MTYVSRWSIIAAQLPGRTDNDIKNYWNTRLKKKLLGRRKKENTDQENSNNSDHTLSNSALERLQLHVQLQNPNFSFYNNPALWPKLHPFQQKVIHNTLQSLNHPSDFTTIAQKDNDLCKPAPANTTNDAVQPEGVKISNPESSVAATSTRTNPVDTGRNEFDMGIDQFSALQAELDDILMSGCVTQQKEQTGEYGCFREIMSGSSKDNLSWWSNDFGAKSASSNSWDSTTIITPRILQPEEGMFQDYDLGYIL